MIGEPAVNPKKAPTLAELKEKVKGTLLESPRVNFVVDTTVELIRIKASS